MRVGVNLAAVGLMAGLLAACQAGPSSGTGSGATSSQWELKGSRLVGCCCSPPCS